MTTENNTTQAAAATLTENELFAEFFESSIAERTKRGKEVYRYNVSELLQPYCDYLDVDFRIVPGDDEDPTTTLEFLENDLLGLLHNVRFVSKEWDKFKSDRLVDDDGDEEVYRMPTPQGEAA